MITIEGLPKDFHLVKPVSEGSCSEVGPVLTGVVDLGVQGFSWGFALVGKHQGSRETCQEPAALTAEAERVRVLTEQ